MQPGITVVGHVAPPAGGLRPASKTEAASRMRWEPGQRQGARVRSCLESAITGSLRRVRTILASSQVQRLSSCAHALLDAACGKGLPSGHSTSVR